MAIRVPELFVTDPEPGGLTADPLSRGAVLTAGAILLLLLLLLLGNTLAPGGEVLLSRVGLDLFAQFVAWRKFGFEQLAQGNLALWNPHVYGGAPFFGGFQAALLYPPNWLYLVLPLPLAVNLGIVLHLWFGGFFMYLWTASRRFHFLACLTAAILFMFCAPHFLHVFAGHLSNLCALVWIPLILLAVEKLLAQPRLRWLLVGTAAVSLQVLAGHPQYVFYTALAVGLYCALRIGSAPGKWRSLAALVLMNVAVLGLTAVQWLSGLQASRECVRAGGVAYNFAAMFSFAPENLLTLLLPNFFGDARVVEYWGRCYLWEQSLFFGVSGFLLALWGVWTWKSRERGHAVILIVVMMVLALGSHTPIFPLLYRFVPGFDLFRGNARFMQIAMIFALLLAAAGFDQLWRSRGVPRLPVWLLLLVALGVGWAGFVLRQEIMVAPQAGWWPQVLAWPAKTGECYLQAQTYATSDYVEASGWLASRSLTWAACKLSGVALLLLLFGTRPRLRRWLGVSVCVVAAAEIFVFAQHYKSGFALRRVLLPDVQKFLADHPGDYRVLCNLAPNWPMAVGANDLWGMDPGVTKRYAEFMNFSQGQDPAQANQYLALKNISPLFRLLRCRFVFTAENGQLRIADLPHPLPRVLLATRWLVKGDRDAVLNALVAPGFDPVTTVVLEEPPHGLNVRSDDSAADTSAGTARIVAEETDRLVLEADVTRPAVLLLTDVWTPSWTARALAGSSQSEYRVQPGDYVLRAIPLRPGHHRLAVEYRPAGFGVGAWISGLSLLLFGGLCVWCLRERRTGTGQANASTVRLERSGESPSLPGG